MDWIVLFQKLVIDLLSSVVVLTYTSFFQTKNSTVPKEVQERYLADIKYFMEHGMLLFLPNTSMHALSLEIAHLRSVMDLDFV